MSVVGFDTRLDAAVMPTLFKLVCSILVSLLRSPPRCLRVANADLGQRGWSNCSLRFDLFGSRATAGKRSPLAAESRSNSPALRSARTLRPVALGISGVVRLAVHYLRHFSAMLAQPTVQFPSVD